MVLSHIIEVENGSGKQCGKTTTNADRPNYGLQNLTGT
jgi:hypothetical protein